MSIKVDTRSFEKALKEVLLNTSRDMPTVLNGHAIAVITKAAALTPKADKASIPFKLYAEAANSKGKPTSIIYMILNARRKAGKGLNNDQMRTAAKKLIDKRAASIGYTAYAGWQAALLAMGGRGFGRGKPQKGFAASGAAQGRGRPATTGSLRAIFSNTAPWIEHIGTEPLRRALRMEEANMLKHIQDKVAQRCKEASKS